MELSLGDVITAVAMFVGMFGGYVSYVSKIHIMETELDDLKQLVTELRLDIKELLAK